MRFHHFRNKFLVGGLALLLGVARAQAWQLGAEPAQAMIQQMEQLEQTTALQQEIKLVLACLQLKPGDIVADIGAGTGVFARPLAHTVGPTGRVLAVDIDPELLRYMERRAQQERILNLETVLGKLDDPVLPSRQVDLAFLHDVLHHIEHRQQYLKALAQYMKPSGRIAVIELNKDDRGNPHNSQPELQLTPPQVEHWMAAVGFHPVAQCKIYRFDEKWFILYSRQ